MATDLTGAAAFLSRTREERNFAIPSQPEVAVGYDRSNDVVVPFEGVSRRHARLAFDGKDYWIEDLGSANGTYLNAARLTQRERLKHLDVVTLGRRADLIFVRRSVEAARKTKRGILAARLEIMDGLDSGTRRDLPRGSVTIGRSAGNNIVADSQLVSKVHARLERSGVELVLSDLQSANGTFVNGERIDSRVLRDGDEISVGRARSYRVRIEEGEVLTGDVALSDRVGTSLNQSLPMDWKTHMEWSPEEAALFDKARAALKPAGPGLTFQQQPGKPGDTAPAPKAPDAKPAKAAPPAAEAKSGATPAERSSVKPPAPPPTPSAAPAPPPKPPAEKAAAIPPPPPAPAAARPASPAPTPPAPAPIKPPPAAPTPPAATPPAPAPVKPAPTAPAAAKPSAAAATPPAPGPVKPPPSAPAPPAAPSPPRSPLPPPAPARDATRALTPDQLPKVFLESPSRTFPLSIGTFEVGRDPAVEVRLEGSEISRRHARIQITEHAAVLEDLKTVNGTYVNRQKLVAPRPLADGDEVSFGSLKFRVRFGAGFPKAEG